MPKDKRKSAPKKPAPRKPAKAKKPEQEQAVLRPIADVELDQIASYVAESTSGLPNKVVIGLVDMLKAIRQRAPLKQETE